MTGLELIYYLFYLSIIGVLVDRWVKRINADIYS